MARSTSDPVVPRWYIGRTLRRMREAKGQTLNDAHKVIGRSIDTVRRIEAGETAVSKGDLTLLLDAYEVRGEEREQLLELQEIAKQRGWWVPFGPVPDSSLALVMGVESTATGMRWFSHFSVPGFLQTTEYALALMAHTDPGRAPEQVRRAAELRPMRYDKMFAEKPIENAEIILDETVLRRAVGGPEVMGPQLQRLLDTPCTLRVVPLDAVHPGVATFGIFDLDTENFGPVVYLEGVRDGEFVIDDEQDVAEFVTSYKNIESVAMTPDESRELVTGLATRRVRR